MTINKKPTRFNEAILFHKAETWFRLGVILFHLVDIIS